MEKASKIVLGILGVVVIAAAITTFWLYSTFYATGPLAMLFVEQGTVQYSTDAAAWKDASSSMKLKEGYSVKTLADSKAKIIFSDSVMRLDSDTEITLDGLAPESISLFRKLFLDL